jgi:hypothetical protein
MRLIKKISLSLLALGAIIVSSCSDNLDVDNNPAIQAQLNGEFYRAVQTNAVNNENGGVSISGTAPAGTVVLNLESSSSGIYFLGPGANSSASFSVDEDNTYSTEFGSGRGELNVFRTDTPNTISAEFSFIAYNEAETDSIYMRQGIAYQVPFGTGFFIPSPDPDLFSAQIDGNAFLPAANDIEVFDNGSAGIEISGAIGSAELIISIPQNASPGTYAFDMMSGAVGQYSDGTNTSGAVSGEIVVTAHNTTTDFIEGTFEFMTDAPNVFDVTSGVFRVSY